MAHKGEVSPRFLSINKKVNGHLSYRVGEVSELTLKGSLTSPTSLLRKVPVVSKDFQCLDTLRADKVSGIFK